MDLQDTKESRKEEGAEGPLEAFGAGGSRSKEYNKKEARDPPNHDDRNSINPLHRRQPSFAYPHSQRSTPTTATRAREPSPSPEAVTIPQALGLGSRDLLILRRALKAPPVTKKSLSELDLPCIMGNINLRMDVNFDRDLHFKPDSEGLKGIRKQKEAKDYWNAVSSEIAVYAFCASCTDATIEEIDGEKGDRHSFDPRLPTLFETLRDIIKTLVPEEDHASVMQNLDVPLLMQQINKGVLDMLSLATWLGTLLKRHCAPMRDEWADSMVAQVKIGSETQDPKVIANGLQLLFTILEAMKLDVANHQIRAFRILLIQDTVPFLQEYFEGKINNGSFPVQSARDWYLAVRSRARQEDENDTRAPIERDEKLKPLNAFFRGISAQLLQFHPPDEFPNTFLCDSERLWSLRSTVQNLINLDIAWYIFESYVNKHKRCLSTPADTYSTFRARIWSLMEDGMDLDNRIAENPRGNENNPDLRGGKRWTENMRCIALEIARFAGAALQQDAVIADEIIAPIEEALSWHLTNESTLFTHFQTSMRNKVLAATMAAAKRYVSLPPMAICDSQRVSPSVAAIGAGLSTAPPLTPQQMDIERIGSRLAHIGILHWRVWAPLLYLRDEIASARLQPALI